MHFFLGCLQIRVPELELKLAMCVTYLLYKTNLFSFRICQSLLFFKHLQQQSPFAEVSSNSVLVLVIVNLCLQDYYVTRSIIRFKAITTMSLLGH